MSLPAFIFVFSVPILRERVTLLKVLAVILQVSGVCVVAVSKDPCVGLSTNSSAANANSSLILRSGKESECHTLNTPLGYVVSCRNIFPFNFIYHMMLLISQSHMVVVEPISAVSDLQCHHLRTL